MKSYYTLTIFIYLFFGSTISKLNFCFDTYCRGPLAVLANIADAFVNTSYLTEYWITRKHYCSWICIKCDASRNIIALNFYALRFMGSISPSFSHLAFLETIVLDGNNLTGTVPDNLTSLMNLRYFDISNNNISGLLPNFSSSVKVESGGNPFLQRRPSLSPRNEENEENEENKEARRFALTKLIVITLAVIFIVVVFTFIFFKFYTNNRRRKGAQSDLNNESVVQVFMNKSEKVIFSIQFLRQATNNFSKDNILGQGGCGVVYRGKLNDGTKIAIKKMNFQALEARGFNEFQAEIDVLTRVRHRHLVALFAYCVDGNARYLVYEYMPQGTLTHHLFDWQENGYDPLTWKQRVIIVLDVARGIEYLHNLATQSFIHRDLKPSNILLDDELRAKVADFGLVKTAPVGQSLETRLAGTFGYLAPEYGATGKVTTKIDVYAFGAILMEILTGRRALDNSLGDDQSHLVTWFRQNIMKNEKIQNIIDQTLELDEEIVESIQWVVELAMHCTTLERNNRPDMNYVVNILDSLVDEWSPIIQNEEDDQYEALQKGLDEG